MCSPARVQTREPSGITGAGCDRVRAPPPAVWPPPREGTRRLPVVGRTAWGDRPHHPDAAGSRHRAISSNLPGPAAASAPRRQSRERSRVLGVPAPVSPGLLQGCCAGGVSSCSPRLDRPPREGNAAAGQSSDRRTWGDRSAVPPQGLPQGVGMRRILRNSCRRPLGTASGVRTGSTLGNAIGSGLPGAARPPSARNLWTQ